MTFLPGQSGNAAGRKPHNADFVARLHHWVATHTIEEVDQIYKNKAKFRKLPYVDGLCCARMYEAMQEGGGNTMEQLFDRLLGKPSQHTTIDARVLAQVTVTQGERALEADREAELMLTAIAQRALCLPSDTASSVLIDVEPNTLSSAIDIQG